MKQFTNQSELGVLRMQLEQESHTARRVAALSPDLLTGGTPIQSQPGTPI